jgi:CHAT domain-containing protein
MLHGEGGEGPVHRVLRGLWDNIVKPILDVLSFSKSDPLSSEALPRIFFCPTGPSSFLPIHAAGIYKGDGSESLLDYAVPSYTPTITALTDRVKKTQQIDRDKSGLFLTSQPNAPDAFAIPGTASEVLSIYGMALKNGTRARLDQGGALTIDDCLQHMKNFSSIHLACHGSQNAAEPLQSRFLFHSGSLELAKILQANLKHADLAFLSACQTSTGHEMLSDEAVHLAAGMLAAGYRRVVGTMWSIGDKPAQEIAEDFYDHIWRSGQDRGEGQPDMSQSAYALHHAMQKMRGRLGDNSERSLLTWIPYVLFGY